MCFGSLNKNYLFLDYILLIHILCFLANLVGLRYLDEAPANGVGHTTTHDKEIPSSSLKPGYDQGSPERKVSRGTKEVNFDIGDSRRSSNSVYVPNESDSEEGETSEQELDLLDDTSRIPKYALFYTYKDYYLIASDHLSLFSWRGECVLVWAQCRTGFKGFVSFMCFYVKNNVCFLLERGLKCCERQKRVPFNPVVCASRKHMYQPKKGN